LGVDYVVEGSVRRMGKHVRVTIQLIDTINDHHLWATISIASWWMSLPPR
jgi:adenylate cyclase